MRVVTLGTALGPVCSGSARSLRSVALRTTVLPGSLVVTGPARAAPTGVAAVALRARATGALSGPGRSATAHEPAAGSAGSPGLAGTASVTGSAAASGPTGAAGAASGCSHGLSVPLRLTAHAQQVADGITGHNKRTGARAVALTPVR